MNVNNLKKNTVYVLNKNEGIIAVFNKDDEDTIIDPIINETQNSEAKLTFQVPAKSKKWKETYNPENLYLVDNKIFSANFSDCIERERNDENEDLITVIAYERQKLLEREYVRAWNSTTGFESIDEFMVVIVSNGNLALKNNDVLVPTTHEKGTSGYVLDGLLYGTGWQTGTCDVQGVFDFETDMENIYDNILKVQEIWGGILVFDSLNKIIHHRDETRFLPYSGFEVKYTKNLQSSKYIGDNKIITALCPLGEGSLNIKSVNNNSVWLTNFSYTDTVLRSIENNDDIYEPAQLKRWGQRKLQELCKPRRELTMTTALLNSVKGYELEEVHLNDIVDVIDYEFVEDRTTQLRVIEYKHYIWSGADADLVIGDITLDSTDIFKKNVKATNLINNGTLDTSKVIDYYKNGQSLKRTLRQIDQVIVDTASELSEADDEIRASVTEVTTRVDTLNNDIVSQDRKITELILSVEGLYSRVSQILDLTKTITSQNGKIVVEEAIKGPLLGLSIYGTDEGILKGTKVSTTTKVSKNTILQKTGLVRIKTESKNIASTNASDYEQGYINIDGTEQTSNNYLRNKNFIEIDNNYSAYFSIKGENYSDEFYYALEDIIFYDNKRKYLTSYYNYFSRRIINNNGFLDAEIIFPKDTVYIKLVLSKHKITDKSLMQILPSEIETIKPQLEYCTEYKEDNTYSGILSNNFIELNGIENYNFYRFTTNFYAKNNTEFELEFNHISSDLSSNAIIGSDNTGFIFYNKYNGSFNTKLFKYNGVDYNINTQNTFYQVKTTLSFKNNVLTLADEDGNIETFNIPVSESFTSSQCITVFDFQGDTQSYSNMEFYRLKIWENQELVADYIPAIYKETSTVCIANGINNTYNSYNNYIGPGILGIKYFVNPTTNFVENNTKKYDFKLNQELRKKDDTRDEFTIVDNNATFIRRIGVDQQGNNYILTNPEYIDYGEISIDLIEGDNYLKVINYDNLLLIQYVKQNPYTEIFATNVELQSSITQLVDLINLEVSQKIGEEELRSALTLLKNEIDLEVSNKVGANEIIAKINLAVHDNQGIITITGNQIIITSTYFQLTANGAITATSGNIGGWQINSSSLSKGLAGLVAVPADQVQSRTEVIYVGRGLGKDGNSVFAVNSVGDVRANSIYLYALSNNDRNPSNIKLYSAAEQVGTDIYADGISTGYGIFGDGIKKGRCMHSPDIDLGMDNTYYCHHTGSDLVFNVNATASTDFNRGPYWIPTGSSDERLKHNIESVNNNLLKAINEIEIKQFVFNNDIDEKINSGIIAQELISICEKYEINIFEYNIIKYGITFPDDENKYFAIDYTQLLLLKTKCLEKRIEKIEEILADKL